MCSLILFPFLKAYVVPIQKCLQCPRRNKQALEKSIWQRQKEKSCNPTEVHEDSGNIWSTLNNCTQIDLRISHNTHIPSENYIRVQKSYIKIHMTIQNKLKNILFHPMNEPKQPEQWNRTRFCPEFLPQGTSMPPPSMNSFVVSV